MRQVTVTKPNKTPLGARPQQRWLDRAKRDLNQVDETAEIEEADNRDLWRNSVEATKGL